MANPQFPKMDLYDGYLGDGYPLCTALPPRAFLRKGARYQLVGGAPRSDALILEPNGSALLAALCDAGDDGRCRLRPEVVLNETLPPLKEFILPGGGPVGAQLHQARTVCRRAERRVVTLCREEPETGEGCLRYLNRLSDALFMLGRWLTHATGSPEIPWKPND